MHSMQGFLMSHTFHQAYLIGSQHGKIRRLSGFRKGHRIPEDHFDAVQEFVRKIGAEEVRQQAEQLHAGLRSTFAYKRKQLEYVCELGVAAIKTPDFEVNIVVDQAAEDPAAFTLSTQVNAFQNAEILEAPGFASLFDPFCNRCVLEFDSALGLEEKIDAIEANDKLADFLDYEPDGSSFTLTLPNPSLRIVATPHSLTLSLPGQRNLRLLIAHSIAALASFANAGVNLLAD